MTQANELYWGDCLQVMQTLDDKSIDAIICDLPYGVLNKKSEGGTWDSIIPLAPLWEQYERICKPNAPIVLFAQGMFTCQLMMSNPKMWRYNLVWDKVNRPTGFLDANRKPLRIHEDICVFYKEQPTYNPQMTIGAKNHKRGAAGKAILGGGKNRCYGNFKQTNDEYTNEKYPTSIIAIDKEHKGNEFHPTQKPVDLLRYLVRTYTNEGDIVLDNTMGSGTTIVACIKEKRRYIGIEKDEKYFALAKKRIDNERAQLTLF